MIIKKTIVQIWRMPLINLYKHKLRNKDFSIIAQNCIGGTLYHDIGCKFNSPTINCSFSLPDFMKFVRNLDYYLTLTPIFKCFNSSQGYPICAIDDISINCVHYSTADEFVNFWQKRKQRIRKDNIYIICSERKGLTKDLLMEFENIKYNKVLFTDDKSISNGRTIIYVPNYGCLNGVEDLTKYADVFGRRYYEKHFDCVSWLNKTQNNYHV